MAMLRNARDVSNEIMGNGIRDEGFRSHTLPDTLQLHSRKSTSKGIIGAGCTQHFQLRS